jgi:hypothetical protein
MKKDEPPPEYLIDFARAYRIYRDVDIARDIARLVKPKEQNDADEPRRTT